MSAVPLLGSRRPLLVVAALLAGPLVAACGDPLDKGPGPRPIGSIAPAAARAESAGSDPVPQRHRGKLPAVLDEPATGDEDEQSPPPTSPPPHGASTL